MLFLLTDSPQKLKLEKIHDTLIIPFYVNVSSPQLLRLFCFLLKTQKKTTTLQQVTGGNTLNLVLKRMLSYFPKNSTTQENITILRLKEDYKTYTKRKTSNKKLNQ